MAKDKPDQKYVIFINGMDGDVHYGSDAIAKAIIHAFKNGAKEITVKEFGL